MKIQFLNAGCVLGDVEIKPRQLDPRSDEESIEMRDDSIEDSEEMRVDPIDVATLKWVRIEYHLDFAMLIILFTGWIALNQINNAHCIIITLFTMFYFKSV